LRDLQFDLEYNSRLTIMSSSLATEAVKRARPHVPLPNEGERPTAYADRVGRWYASWTSSERKKHFGQYLTPLETAHFMAELVEPQNKDLRILDPGAGTGVLSCALLERLASKSCDHSIEIEAYESDLELIDYLNDSLSYAKKWLESQGRILRFRIWTDDFVISHSKALKREPQLFCDRDQKGFDLVISNPPYFKIPKSDPRAKASAIVVHGQPNIYMLFMAVSASLLKEGGEMVFITPRSYAAGPYFRRFREFFFSIMQPKAIHLFGSRTKTFERDEVLQENAILYAQRNDGWSRRSVDELVRVSHSAGVRDLPQASKRFVPLRDVLELQTKDRMLNIPIAERQDEVARLVNSWKGSLHSYGLETSTGPVVPFRAVPLIYSSGEVPEKHAPLIWMQHVTPMRVEWPKASFRKEQYIVVNDNSFSLLVPAKNYVLLRRFSAKEERRRLVAAPFLKKDTNSQFVGLENHLNYIYRPKGEVSEEETSGLAALLNSDIFDTYFRIFNGNTQVSATELRRMPLPPLDLIREIGRQVMNSVDSRDDLDEIVSAVLNPIAN
jgi:adenine-specific DNA-methyltransferase